MPITETQTAHELFYTLTHEIELPESENQSWQTIVDLVAQIAGVRAGLIVKAGNNEAETLIVSNSPDNPYSTGNLGALIGSGFYSEKVISADQMLLISDSTKTEEWENNRSRRLGMIAFLGFPIHLPDGTVFGTICLLDDKKNEFLPPIITLMEKMRDLIESHLKLLHLNAYDPLTGLYNRTAFNRLVMRVTNEAQKRKEPLTALMMDIDHFKHVNDEFGHLIGDEVLKNFASLIRGALNRTDIAARFGGEEFIALLPIPLHKALEAAEVIRALTESASWLPYGKVTVSIGAAEYRLGEKIEAWLNRADTAMYKAKNNGRNRVEVYDESDAGAFTSVHFVWKAEWSSGSGRIDSDHITLLQLGNRLVNSSLAHDGFDKILARLEELLNHTSAHFAAEEEIIIEAGYPGAAEHAELHKDILRKALELKEAYMLRSVKESAFFSFLVDEVIVGHMLEEDTKFFEYTSQV